MAETLINVTIPLSGPLFMRMFIRNILNYFEDLFIRNKFNKKFIDMIFDFLLIKFDV